MQMLRAKCANCDWIYDCVTLPMAATPACNTMSKVACPMCGNHKGNLVADPRDLTPEERLHKVRAMSLERIDG